MWGYGKTLLQFTIYLCTIATEHAIPGCICQTSWKNHLKRDVGMADIMKKEGNKRLHTPSLHLSVTKVENKKRCRDGVCSHLFPSLIMISAIPIYIPFHFEEMTLICRGWAKPEGGTNNHKGYFPV